MTYMTCKQVAQRPLFIPLKTEFYEAFANGTKTVEFRQYGPRWNEKTCVPGRAVVLSKGYGKKHRLNGVIREFVSLKEPTFTEAWRKCYGSSEGMAACIHIEVEK